MQSNKASKKTSKLAEESLAKADNTINAEPNAKTRSAKSSKPKSETGDTAAAKRHRKAQTPVPAEETQTASSEEVATVVAPVLASPEPQVETSEPIAAAAAVAPQAAPSAPQASEEEVRKLAYQFWLQRGMPHGSDHEDWIRAKRELAAGA